MPRANTQKHFAQQSKWEADLLIQPPAAKTIAAIRELAATTGTVPASNLAKLLPATPEYIRSFKIRVPAPSVPNAAAHIPLESALNLVSEYLPKVLDWKTLTALGKELGLHRNTVESVVRLHGKPEMIRLCRDNCLYISPEGEKLVRERKSASDLLKGQELVADFAKRLKVPINHVTAFFSARSMRFESDLRGRSRISDVQKELFLQQQRKLELRRSQADQITGGERLRSLRKLAEERASLFARPGSELHAIFTARSEDTLRHFARRSGNARKTELGVYVPVESAQALIGAVSLADAARLLKIPPDMVEKWRRAHRLLAPATSNSPRQRGISLSKLAEVAAEQFTRDPALAQREVVPTIITSLMAHQFAKSIGTSFSTIVAHLPISPQDKELLEERSGELPRATHNLIVTILSPDPSRKQQLFVDSTLIEQLSLNAKSLDLSSAELLELALSPAIAARYETTKTPLKMGGRRFRALLAYGLTDAHHFDSVRVTSAADLLELLQGWSARNRINIRTALSVIDLPASDQQALTKGNGELPGGSVKKIIALTRMTADEARLAHPRVFAASARFEDNPSRASAIAQWGKGMVDAPLIRSMDELGPILEDASHGDVSLKLKESRLGPELVLSLIHKVATARRISPEVVYEVSRNLFAPVSPWPPSYPNFVSRIKNGSSHTGFATVVGKFLAQLADPTLRVYQLGISTTQPKVGDLFVNTTMHDYGIVREITQDDGGRLALVKLVLKNGNLLFRV